MRLICPKCEAQYEVPTDVIPDEGRDVQCSNCGTTWFQAHPRASAANDHAAPAVEPPRAEPAPDTDTSPAGATPGAGQPSAPAPDESGAETLSETPAPADPQATPPEQPRARRLDPAVAEVLRAEAERESRQRATAGAAPAPGPHGASGSDPAPGAPKADPHSAPKDETGRARVAAASTGDVGGRGRYDRAEDRLGDQGPTPAEIASRRGLLPDVNEINQSLRPGEKRPKEAPLSRGRVIEQKKSSGFGRGFVTILVIGILLIALYLAAPAIAEAVPALADPLALYVAGADAARVWLDAQITALLAWLNGTTSGA
ncbi:thioredoxin [Roseivivax halodurans JCM 10272]|uniref:Thioredoxin n=1 Tax=Roseivivax halodurans JCM 10272 TaxID=1449350 RepID=X7EGW9_9RHOB|nr:zinc-ribbon domain-containing protein [Roseivivax halodurans]ETX15130.1 thioredoxin [Roseivivax halodurans JCM 10272]